MRKTIVSIIILFSTLTNSISVHAALSGGLVDLSFAASSGLVTTVFAKEMCSCHFISGLSLEECLARDNLNSMLENIVSIEVDELKAQVQVELNTFGHVVGGTTEGKLAMGRFDREIKPYLGCQLVDAAGDDLN